MILQGVYNNSFKYKTNVWIFSLVRYKCKACNIEIYFDKSGIDAHIERHPKLTFESYSEKYETSLSTTAPASNEAPVKSPAEEKKREEKSPIAKLATEVKLEVNAKPPSPLEGKVKVKPPSSPAKSMMSNSSSRSSQPGAIKVQIFETKSPWRVPCLIFQLSDPILNYRWSNAQSASSRLTRQGW